MTDIRTKLLAAVGGTSVDDVTTELLIDVLADKIARLEKANQELRSENIGEREMLRAKADDFDRELHRIRTNPLAMLNGHYAFLSNVKKGSKIIVLVQVTGCRFSSAITKSTTCAQRHRDPVAREDQQERTGGVMIRKALDRLFRRKREPTLFQKCLAVHLAGASNLSALR